MKKIVIIGGGTGTSTLLTGLRRLPTENSVVVSTADDGGSSGKLRSAYNIVPPGDIRQCLVSLAYTDEILKQAFNYRFTKGELKGHALGNLIITALQNLTGNIEEAISIASRLLNVRGEIVPVTKYATQLSAKYSSGQSVIGESKIDAVDSNNKLGQVSKIQVTPARGANEKAVKLIQSADVLIFGPGDLFTSTLPNLAIKEILEAVNSSKALKVLVVNLLNKPGQTQGFKASDYVKTFEQYCKLTHAIINTAAVNIQGHYKRLGYKPVEVDVSNLQVIKLKLITKPVVAKKVFEQEMSKGKPRSVIRHDSYKLAKLIFELSK